MSKQTEATDLSEVRLRAWQIGNYRRLHFARLHGLRKRNRPSPSSLLPANSRKAVEQSCYLVCLACVPGNRRLQRDGKPCQVCKIQGPPALLLVPTAGGGTEPALWEALDALGFAHL